MSEIRVGDLVMVVRGHGCTIGLVGKVASIRPAPTVTHFYCRRCGSPKVSESADHSIWESGHMIPLAWLKKIDPPSEPERVETDLPLETEV